MYWIVIALSACQSCHIILLFICVECYIQLKLLGMFICATFWCCLLHRYNTAISAYGLYNNIKHKQLLSQQQNKILFITMDTKNKQKLYSLCTSFGVQRVFTPQLCNRTCVCIYTFMLLSCDSRFFVFHNYQLYHH